MFNGYHILLKFFYNGYKGNDYAKDDYLYHEKHNIEGDLQGILEKIDYIKDLGVDLVYLGPIYDAETTHGYDTKDYFNISENIAYKDPEKSKALLQEVIDEFHKRGIKVILDLVLNHASKNYLFDNIPYNLTPKTESPQSPQELRWQKLFLFWDVEDPDTKEFLIKVGEYWLKNFDIDGYRLDHAVGLPTYFWFDFSKRMKEIKKDAILLGEVWDDQGDDKKNYNLIKNFLFYRNENVFTSLFDFSFYSKMTNCIIKNFDLKKLYEAIKESEKLNFKNAKMTYFVENHDLPRFIDYSDNLNYFKIALGLIFFMNGNIMLEYGNEISLHGDKAYWNFNESGRVPMVFPENWNENEREIYNYTKKLLSLREKHDILTSGSFKYIESSKDHLFLEKRSEKETAEIIILKSEIMNTFFDGGTNILDGLKYNLKDVLKPGIYVFLR
jgi:glycosidase